MGEYGKKQDILDGLNTIAQGVQSLKESVKEEFKEEKKPKSIREKALNTASAMCIPGGKVAYIDRYARADLIESLVREELEFCLNLVEKHKEYCSAATEATKQIRTRLDQ